MREVSKERKGGRGEQWFQVRGCVGPEAASSLAPLVTVSLDAMLLLRLRMDARRMQKDLRRFSL